MLSLLIIQEEWPANSMFLNPVIFGQCQNHLLSLLLLFSISILLLLIAPLSLFPNFLILSPGTRLNKLSYHLSYFSELLVHHLLDLNVTSLLPENIASIVFSTEAVYY